jgi:hypothetical protein
MWDLRLSQRWLWVRWKPSDVLEELSAFTVVSCLAYSSTLKMEAICFSKASGYFQRTTRRYIPEDSTLQYSILFGNVILFILLWKNEVLGHISVIARRQIKVFGSSQSDVSTCAPLKGIHLRNFTKANTEVCVVIFGFVSFSMFRGYEIITLWSTEHIL